MSKKKKKAPVIREGQTTPYTKATEEQADERTEKCRQLMAAGYNRYAIHRVFKEEYGLTWRTSERYMTRARLLLLAEECKTRTEVRSDAIGFYQGVIINKNASMRDRIEARKRLDEIFGTDAPRTHHVTTPIGQPFKIEDVTEFPKISPSKIAALLAKYEKET